VVFLTRARGRCKPPTRARGAALVHIIYGGGMGGGARARARVNGFIRIYAMGPKWHLGGGLCMRF
jgi:hypothetical protein